MVVTPSGSLEVMNCSAQVHLLDGVRVWNPLLLCSLDGAPTELHLLWGRALFSNLHKDTQWANSSLRKADFTIEPPAFHQHKEHMITRNRREKGGEETQTDPPASRIQRKATVKQNS